MTIGLYMLRCFQTGLHMADLEQLEYGDVIDMFIEHSNDSCEYTPLATKEEIKNF